LLLSLAGGLLTLCLPQSGAALAGTFALYLTLTAWATSRPGRDVGYLEFFTLLVALCVVASGVDVGLTSTGAAAGVAFVLAAIAALAAGGDLRLLIHNRLQGRQRVVRYLWRLATALLIGSGSIATVSGSIRA
jgi:hypothetical protein